MNRAGRLLASFLGGFLCLCRVAPCLAQMPVYGDYYAHDPSTMIKFGNRYYIYRTSPGIMGKYSTDLRNWAYSGQVFPNGPPAWTSNAVPGFTASSSIWAPDIVLVNDTYYLYYSVSTFGSQVSAIGLVTTTNLDTGPWTDQGPVIQSSVGSLYNCIDPCPLLDTNGTMWLSFGSFWNGIFLIQLDPATGMRISPGSPITQLAYKSAIEASYLCQHGGYYYLFVNWGACCRGINSTYNIAIGRSTSVTGPYLDRNGGNMVSGAGSVFLESTGRFIGPGQTGIMNDNGTYWFTYHYYDGNNNGTATLGLAQMTWGADGWPVLTNDWSAFYTFDVDAREHLALYNGTLRSGAVITNDPARGNVLSLDGVSQYISLPNPVANASTFSAWVNWNGGATSQHLFDFGSNTSKYLYLSPRASSGKMRFAISTSGSGGEQGIEASSAMPTGSWCHVAVSLEGSQGLLQGSKAILYLDGIPAGSNTSLSIRPWQLLARSNYIGRSQSPTDPFFSGEVDSVRIFGRALTGAEIRDLAYAHPALAHRYSFTSSARDSIGMAHGSLMGNATVTNGALRLDGAAGDYVNLPGGLASGSSSATVEFWATFGTNGNWARVFDFGNISGTIGQNFLFFTPHTSTGGQRLGLSTGSGTVNFDVPGTFDNQTLHVVCVTDPRSGYSAIYTNGMLESALSNALPALTGVSSAWSFIGRSLFSADAWLNGTIDELRIYDGRLTPAEIAVNDVTGPDALALPVGLSCSNSDAGLVFTWPAWAVGFVLESTPALGPSAVWTPIVAAPALGNNVWGVTLGLGDSAGYYRLRR